MSYRNIPAVLIVVSAAMMFISVLPYPASSAEGSTELAFILSCNPLENVPRADRVHVHFDPSNALGIKMLLIGAIRFYQLFISPQDMPSCNFVPSCSQFGAEAIRQLGILRGVLLTSDRLQRCNSMSISRYHIDYKSGKLIDPVQNYLDFRSPIFDFRFSRIANRKSKIENVPCLASSSYGDNSEEINYYSPENMLKFAEHLYQEGDYLRAAGEYQRYLFYSIADADSTLYKIGLCYRQAGDTVRAISFFRKVVTEYPESDLHFAASYQIAYSYFLAGHYESSIQYMNRALDEIRGSDERAKLQILAAFNYLHQRRWRDAEYILGSVSPAGENMSSIASALRVSAREGIDLRRKNPVLAGVLSAILPGTGRMYCREYGDGFYSLILIGVSALLAWDGFRENGLRSVRGWLFGSMSGVFYAGNVYGSSIAARVYNRQLEMDILERLPAVPDEMDF